MAFVVAPAYGPPVMEDPMDTPELLSPETLTADVPARLDKAGEGIQEIDVMQAARTGACVLLTGEKDPKRIALQIHSLSGWRWGPFLSVDCGTSEQILERQLFDVLKAAEWNGAPVPRPQLIQDGTIFLFEVGKLSLAMQSRLADALGSATPGEAQPRLRKRIMASTSVPLLDRVLAGTFDDRLFYRLNAFHLVPTRPAGR
jgi:DNA-binding NtrC family response regulator